MKVLILWSRWSGYMDSCARSLQDITGCELDIVVLGENKQAPYDSKSFFQYECQVWQQIQLEQNLSTICRKKYDLVLICGWHIPLYLETAKALRGKAVCVLCMDNQWLGTARQYFGIGAFRFYLKRHFDFVFVPGWRQALFATKLGFSVNRVIEGHYSCNVDEFKLNGEILQAPHNFLFTARLVQEKGVEILAAAWARFCEIHAHAQWTLSVCGVGPLESILANLPRVNMHGFVQPAELPVIMRGAGAFLLPSRFEPWGLVLHEAAASGLPLIATNRCGAADYFLRHELNGYLVNAGSVDELVAAMSRFAALPALTRIKMGKLSHTLGMQRSPLTWASAVTRANLAI